MNHSSCQHNIQRIADPQSSSSAFNHANSKVQNLSHHYRKKKFDQLKAEVDGQEMEIRSLTRQLERETELHEQLKQLGKQVQGELCAGAMYQIRQ